MEARLALASFLWATRRHPEAEELLKAVIVLEPANVMANRALGMFYLASQRPKEAEVLFETIARSGKEPSARLALADYYIAVRRNQDARKALLALSGQPDVATAASLRLATLDALDGLVAQARERLQGVIDKDPRNTGALLMRARLNLLEKEARRRAGRCPRDPRD